MVPLEINYVRIYRPILTKIFTVDRYMVADNYPDICFAMIFLMDDAFVTVKFWGKLATILHLVNSFVICTGVYNRLDDCNASELFPAT